MKKQIIIHAIKTYSNEELIDNENYICQCGYKTKDHEDFILHCNINKLRKQESKWI